MIALLWHPSAQTWSCLLLLSACVGTSEVESLPTPSPEDRGGACSLPAARPPDLAVRLHRAIVPHGELPRSEGVLLQERCTEVPDPLCREVPAAVMDSLYRRFLDAGFAGLGQDSPGAASPHYGTRSLSLVWSDGQQVCTVADAAYRTLPEAEREIFGALFRATLEALPPAP